ncbi:hypothetical protein I7I53_00135 [Histoplasma capsulatum var. duboisii H88]|uniref:E3 ubiquitin protein ligase n=1 Tax=Ajellomyces capsulatus (strain H88) TaxID=544711 RepID=A0A8A1LK39_AJEC8|nr:hypothetical protein I7I53_00135 [Histoplasma capsulatum var. duboisii H88]
MASADSSRTVIIISDETDEQPLAQGTRRSQRKRTFTDYSYPTYDGPSDDLVSSDALESEMEWPPKKQKISNLDTVLETANQEIHTIFEAERAKRRKLEEEVQTLEEEVQHLRAETTMKDELFSNLETKIRELQHRCQCEICYSIPSGWRTLLPCGHRFCAGCLRPLIGDDCPKCRKPITGIFKSY